MLKKTILLFFLISLWAAKGFSASCSDAGVDKPFSEAVPAVIQCWGESIQNIPLVSQLAEWGSQIASRVGEFVSDQVTAVQLLAQKAWNDFFIEPLHALKQKWNDIITEAPKVTDIQPAVSPIITSLANSLPQLSDTPEQVPLQNISTLYNQSEAQNPWGMGTLFHREENKGDMVATVTEETQETRQHGVKTTSVVNRHRMISVDGQDQVIEDIKDGQVVNNYQAPKAPTVLHEALDKLKAQVGNSNAVIFWQQMIEAIQQRRLQFNN
jgi:hypothetical protein